MAQQIVYVLTYAGLVMGVYETHEDAEGSRLDGIHATKQIDARVWQCVVKPTGTRGF